MAIYEVTWNVKYRYTRFIEAGTKLEAVEISTDMGNAGVELEDYGYEVSRMIAKSVDSRNLSVKYQGFQ